MDIDNKNILVTGATGSFGSKMVETLIGNFNPNKIIIYSRDELKQSVMQKRLEDKYDAKLIKDKLRFFIGDIRDADRLMMAMNDVNIVIHAAALKQVPAAEYNPMECIKTNIMGAQNVIDASISADVSKVIALSTDKAANPINLYGATKLASDKLFTAANNIGGKSDITFSVVRYGNVFGSRGSVVPFYVDLLEKNHDTLPITDERMTRFMITLEEGVDLVWKSFDEMIGGEIFVKKIPSMNILDIARAFSDKPEFYDIGIRPGEKLHEQMIGIEDSPYTFEYDDYFKILPSIHNWHTDPDRISAGEKVNEGFKYISNENTEWMSVETLKAWIESN